jgi:hypothetical protein
MSDDNRMAPEQPGASPGKGPVSDEPLHWSERAKVGLPSLRPSGSRSARPSRRRSKKKLLIVAACLVGAAAVAAAAIVLTTSRGDGTGTPNSSTGPSTALSVQTTDAGAPFSTAQQTASTSTALTSTGSTSTASTSEGASTTNSIAPTSTTSASTVVTFIGFTDATETVSFADTELGFSFVYPASWEEFPQEDVAGTFVSPTLGIAIGDPLGGMFGTTPANYIMFAAYQDPSGAATPARQALEEWAAQTESEATEPLTVIESVTAFQVNNVVGAMKTYSTESEGRPLVMRVCFITNAGRVFVFTFCAEEGDWETDKPIFDATLASFSKPE